MKQALVLSLVLVFGALSGCAAKDVDPTLAAAYEPGNPSEPRTSGAAPVPDPASTPDPTDDEMLDDSDFDNANSNTDAAIADPLEPWNRIWFYFNDFTYMNIIKPLYMGYEFIAPEALRTGLSNALRNLQAPIRIVNSILQFEFAQAVVELGRFIVNTTAGGLGLAEIVKPEDALVPINLANADFGGTLAKWGMGEGVYLVWPFTGPSTVRDTIGLAGDIAAGIPFWVSEPIGPVNSWVNYAVAGGLRFNEFGTILDNYEALTKAAIEPYVSVRDAYVKLRRSAALPARITW